MRRAGVLVHPTSLPGPFGIGDTGPDTVRFLDWAAEAGFRAWQILPLGPADGDGSPYNARSAFAGNALLVSPRRLVESGLLPADALDGQTRFADGRVDFEPVARFKNRLLRASWRHFRTAADPVLRDEYSTFVEHPDQQAWLEDWALYAALKSRLGESWTEWDAEIRLRRPAGLRRAGRELADEVAFQRYVQFLFSRQWSGMRRAARRRGISLFGDLPFYVAHDSADVWAHPELFALAANGRPAKVAGVPPDYFSETGQLWGNPVFRWDRLAESEFAWWIERLRANLRLVDLLRLDHFRGYAAFWEVDGREETAVNGRWAAGPGKTLFDAVRASLGDLPIVAEDLGLITPDVVALRDELALPGMYVLQFAFGGDDEEALPGQHRERAVVYTGTHDNDTSRGWFESLDESNRRRVLDRLGADPQNVCRRMVEAAYESPARLAVVPLQDLLELDSEARMNRPGVVGGNWSWRVDASSLTLELASRYRMLARQGGR